MIIIGAGVSGLYTGIEVLKKYPGKKCYILEKYKVNGGRVITHYAKKEQWEIGAGRIAKSHKKFLALCKKYKVSLFPISTDSYILPYQPNPFFDLYSAYVEPLHKLSQNILKTHTLGELLEKVHKNAKTFYSLFPYDGEIHTLRADIALESFRTEMGKNEKFYGVKEGLSAVIKGMTNEFLERGGIILNEMEVTEIIPGLNIKIICKNASFDTDCCVLAVPTESIKPLLKDAPKVLNKLSMLPLVRIYAVFPVKNGKTWFTGMGKMVVSAPIRYIIPVSSNAIMISYTDGHDAQYWLHKIKSKENVMKEIRKLFPDLQIPEPLVYKVYPWNNGCTYWLPGQYDVKKESIKSLHPIMGVPLFMTGESFSPKQCWIESALDQSDELLRSDAFSKAIHKET